jgi:hypothetical protein
VATIGEAGIAEVDAEVEAVVAVDDGVELEPHAATHAATTAATAMNRTDVHLCVSRGFAALLIVKSDVTS